MKDTLTIKEAAEYLHVSKDTLRLWDKSGKLQSHKTPGGHRRYFLNEINNFIRKKDISYGSLYEHLCSAQFIADSLEDSHANEILRIREEIGQILLNSYGIQ